MVRVSDPIGVDHELRRQYAEAYFSLQYWRDYANGGELPRGLRADQVTLDELNTPDGRELIATWVRVYRIPIKQLLACPPDEEYNTAEIVQLCQQVMKRLSELHNVLTAGLFLVPRRRSEPFYIEDLWQ